MPSKTKSLEDLVQTFQDKYARKPHCLVCDSPNRELVEILMRGGSGGPSISRFLRGELDERISEAVLGRHKSEHLDVEVQER